METSPIFQTVYYRNAADVRIEHDIALGNMLDVGQFFALVQVPLQTPQGPIPLDVRVHLRGAEGVQHAFDNFDTMVRANVQQDASAAQKEWEKMQRAAMLRGMQVDPK